MSTDLSRTINFKRLAMSGESLDGVVRLDAMQRLSGLIQDLSGHIEFSLSFNCDDADIYYLDSVICGQVTMECQRCLEPVVVNIKRQSLLGITSSIEEMKSLPQRYDPLLLEDDLLSIDELIEDELLLALPLAPLHEEDNCKASDKLAQINEDAKPKPFAVLEGIKRNKE